jgi:hypothetical protein
MTHTKHRHEARTLMATVGLLGGLLTAVSTATAGMSLVPLDEIPTRLVLPVDPEDYPDPICLGCKIIAKRTTSTDDDDIGILSVTYEDDQVRTFVGDIVLTVFLLDSDELRTVTLDGLVLTDGQTVELAVTAGSDWGWEDVESVWVELVHAP